MLSRVPLEDFDAPERIKVCDFVKTAVSGRYMSDFVEISRALPRMTQNSRMRIMPPGDASLQRAHDDDVIADASVIGVLSRPVLYGESCLSLADAHNL